MGTELQINMFPAETYTIFPPALLKPLLPTRHLQPSSCTASSLQTSARRARVGHVGVTREQFLTTSSMILNTSVYFC